MKGLSRKFFSPTHYRRSAYFSFPLSLSPVCIFFFFFFFSDCFSRYFVRFSLPSPCGFSFFRFNRFEVLESRRTWHARIRAAMVMDDAGIVSMTSWRTFLSFSARLAAVETNDFLKTVSSADLMDTQRWREKSETTPLKLLSLKYYIRYVFFFILFQYYLIQYC